MCLFLLLLLFGPRLVGVLWWLFEPVRWNAAFGTILLPVLGVHGHGKVLVDGQV